MGRNIRLLLLSPLFLILIAEIISVKANDEISGSHHHNYEQNQEGNFEDPLQEIRWKRDVLKGKDHDFASPRSKRYIGRVPVSYMKKVVPPVDIESYDDNENDNGDDIPSGVYNNQAPVASHFREFQMRQGGGSGIHPKSNKIAASLPRSELTLEEPRMLPAMSKTHRNQRRYIPNIETQQHNSYQPSPNADEGDETTLSDDDIQSLLLMLDGYELTGGNRPKHSRQSETYYAPGGYLLAPGDLERVAQMYAAGKKRETGKRSIRNYEQPMSFDNALYPGEDRLEFLNEKRSKRIGARNLMAKTTTSNRFKKETDPAVLATLEKFFNTQANKPDLVKAPHDSAVSELSSDTSGSSQVINDKPKKSIDWKNHFGIDKRANERPKGSGFEIVQGNNHHNDAHENKGIHKEGGELESVVQPTVTLHPSVPSHTSSSASPSPHQVSTAGINKDTKDKDKAKKVGDRKENETENKEVDRDWILQEFYKNFAMSTNVKRKRESPSMKPKSDLEKLEELEKKMAEAGDQIIWDALKYTGAHRDASMSPNELAQVKNSIIQKLSTAYSLEKVREAVDELREQISTLEERNKE